MFRTLKLGTAIAVLLLVGGASAQAQTATDTTALSTTAPGTTDLVPGGAAGEPAHKSNLNTFLASLGLGSTDDSKSATKTASTDSH